MTSPFTQTPNFVIPDLIGNPWSALSFTRNGQAMDSRLRGNDKIWCADAVCGEAA